MKLCRPQCNETVSCSVDDCAVQKGSGTPGFQTALSDFLSLHLNVAISCIYILNKGLEDIEHLKNAKSKTKIAKIKTVTIKDDTGIYRIHRKC